MVSDFCGHELAKEDTQMHVELSHRPEEASEIGVSGNFLEEQVGTKPGLVESLSLKQFEPSHHNPFPSSTGNPEQEVRVLWFQEAKWRS